MQQQRKQRQHNSNKIIQGKFKPSNKKQKKPKINHVKLFVMLLSLSLLVSLYSYSSVLSKEKALSKLDFKIDKLNKSNDEINPKLQQAKGLYNVKEKASRLKHLGKAKKTIEVISKGPAEDFLLNKIPSSNEVNVVHGY